MLIIGAIGEEDQRELSIAHKIMLLELRLKELTFSSTPAIGPTYFGKRVKNPKSAPDDSSIVYTKASIGRMRLNPSLEDFLHST